MFRRAHFYSLAVCLAGILLCASIWALTRKSSIEAKYEQIQIGMTFEEVFWLLEPYDRIDTCEMHRHCWTDGRRIIQVRSASARITDKRLLTYTISTRHWFERKLNEVMIRLGL